MSSVLQQRSFIFEKLSLQTAVFIAMGVEISICVLHAIFGFTHTTLPYVLFQLVELLVCGSVLVGIKKGSHRVLLVYLIYNVGAIILLAWVIGSKEKTRFSGDRRHLLPAHRVPHEHGRLPAVVGPAVDGQLPRGHPQQDDQRP